MGGIQRGRERGIRRGSKIGEERSVKDRGEEGEERERGKGTWEAYRVFFWWVGKKFVGHCYSVMHEYETFSSFEYDTIQILNFSSGGKLRLGRGEIPGPPTLPMQPWEVGKK